MPEDANGLTTRVYRYSIERSGGTADGLQEVSQIDIVNPTPPDDYDNGCKSTVVTLAEDPNGSLLVVGFAAPWFPEYHYFPDGASFFTTPTLAEVPLGSTGPVAANPLVCGDLVMPLSAVFVGGGPVETYTLTLTINNENYGSVTVEPNLSVYPSGTPVTLTAEPNEGRGFKKWKVYDPNYPGDAHHIAIDSNNPLALLMNSDWQVEAIFTCGGSGLDPLLPLALWVLSLAALMRRRR